MKKVFFVFVVAYVLSSDVIKADNEFYQRFIPQIVKEKIQPWLADELLVQSIIQQNKKHKAITQKQIDQLEQTWKRERKSAVRPFIDTILKNEVSDFLKIRKAESEGLFSEIIVMDDKGLCVGISDITSDYWQADEEKWQETYQADRFEPFIGKLEYDESTEEYQIQVSLTVKDPASDQKIGAITIGINVQKMLDLLAQ